MSKPAVVWRIEEKPFGKFQIVREVYGRGTLIGKPFPTREEAREAMGILKRSYQP